MNQLYPFKLSKGSLLLLHLAAAGHLWRDSSGRWVASTPNSKRDVHDRTEKMIEQGLLSDQGRNFLELTELGKQYLRDHPVQDVLAGRDKNREESMNIREVAGFCPMGCGQTLFLGTGGHVTCSALSCLRPTAADEILSDREAGHIVELGQADFSMVHPLRERLDNGLLHCELRLHLESLPGPPQPVGRYRVTGTGDDWFWGPLGG